MPWLVGLSLLVLVIAAALAAVVHVHRRRFAVRVASEVRALLASPASRAPPAVAPALPAVVERYRLIAVGDRAPVHTLRLRHGGTFQMSPTSRPRPIRGVQWFTADPPGFVWRGRIALGPGAWIDARDMLVAGTASMRVLLDDTAALADAHGPQIDQGSALRLLAELVWYPTALFDPRAVSWDAIDPSHARATLRVGDQTVSGVFAFGPDGLPTGMTAQRFTDKGALTPWGGVYRDWRTVAGMRVPFEAEVSWQLASPYIYAHWRIDAMEYDLDPSALAAAT